MVSFRTYFSVVYYVHKLGKPLDVKINSAYLDSNIALKHLKLPVLKIFGLVKIYSLTVQICMWF